MEGSLSIFKDTKLWKNMEGIWDSEKCPFIRLAFRVRC